MPSGYVANSSHLCHTRIYKAIFSIKSLQPSLPAVWHLTLSFEHPQSYVVVSGWQCPGLSFQEEHAYGTDTGSWIRDQTQQKPTIYFLLRINFISHLWTKNQLFINMCVCNNLISR